MLILSLLCIFQTLFVAYLLIFHIPNLEQHRVLYRQLLDKQDQYIDQLMGDVVSVGIIAHNERIRATSLAQHILNQEGFPSLTIQHLN